MRPVLLALLFLAIAAISITLVVMLVVPEVAGLFAGTTDEPAGIWRALATLGVVIALVFGALYLAGLLWLFLACHLFKREEVEQFLKMGPNTRLEIWVFERFSR